MASKTADKKGKAKAVEATSNGKRAGDSATGSNETARTKPAFSAGPAPVVIHYFVEAGSSVQRGYNKELFQEAYELLTESGEKEEEAKAKAIKVQKEEREAKTKNWTAQIDFLLRELQISRKEAEEVLIRCEGDLHKSLLELTSPAHLRSQSIAVQ